MAAADVGVLPQAAQAGFRPRSLDAVNFLLADVRGALGLYLNVFLITRQPWSQTEVGWVTTISQLLGLVAQTPAGSLIDTTRRKRLVIVAALAALAAGAVAIFAAPRFWPVMAANTTIAVVGDVFGLAIAALTLGLYARQHLARRMGRNSAYDHAGNVMIALLAAASATCSRSARCSCWCRCFASWRRSPFSRSRVWPSTRIARAASRTSRPGPTKSRPATWRCSGAGRSSYFRCARCCSTSRMRPCCRSSARSWRRPARPTAMMSCCIIAAQLIMLPVALAVGHTADRIGRKPILLAGFAILPLRAVLYTVSNNAGWLIGVQLLDGIGAGIFGAITPLLVADLMRGTGRYNLAQGAVATMQGLGASLSGLAAGEIVDRFGYTAAFLGFGAAACVALAALSLAMPETAPRQAGGASIRVPAG